MDKIISIRQNITEKDKYGGLKIIEKSMHRYWIKEVCVLDKIVHRFLFYRVIRIGYRHVDTAQAMVPAADSLYMVDVYKIQSNQGLQPPVARSATTISLNDTGIFL